MEYTEEQRKDARDRVEKAAEMLKDLQLAPASRLEFVKLDEEGVFGIRMIPSLGDTKFLPSEESNVEVIEESIKSVEEHESAEATS